MKIVDKTNKKVIFMIFMIMFAVLTLVGIAFARYITKLNGTTTADIAKWSIKINGSTNQNFVIDLANTRTGVEQEAEVQEGYIGPGTAGAFEIELDATGSEASLEYDINLNVDYNHNTVFPKNLIFYTDSAMQNAIYHSDAGINLNGFIGWNDNSQVHTKTIYWSWDYETGSTQNEINANDELDSYWIGKPITLSMNVTAKQVNENPTTGQYAVTFDANGGTLQGYGNASQATKMVTYGEKYGSLPEPKREGYRFLGWNGKNLLNLENYIYNGTYYKVDDSEITIIKSDSMAGLLKATAIGLTGNRNYTISGKIIGEYTGRIYAFFGSDLNYSSVNNGTFCNTFWFKSTDDKEALKIYQNYPNDSINTNLVSDTVVISNIMLEEGKTATAYEPYYITSSTEVVQNQNHTLTAIWEEE